MDVQALPDLAISTVAMWTPKIVGALAALFFGLLFAGRVRNMSRTALATSRVDDLLIPFLSGMIQVFIVLIVGVTAIGVLGVGAASFVAVLGAAGVALAFQRTFSNFAAGIMLLTFRPFEVGDFVEVGGSEGSVNRADFFSTKTDLLRTLKENLEAAGSSIPYPQRDVHLYQQANG